MGLPILGRGKRELQDSVVVITGASSGIGRATALAFAAQGARVVPVARRGEALAEVARACEALGAEAWPVTADVRDADAIEAVAEKALARFGRIDTWVNNAAVSMFGRFEETPPELFNEVVQTNLLGYVHGARAALRRFREQGSGVLINVSSAVGEIGQPYTTAYVSTKWAILGFTESLRMELALDQGHDIQACAVLPAAIDTPLFQQAANFTRRTPRPLQPVYQPEMVAERIVAVAQRPRAKTYAGRMGRAVGLRNVLMPAAEGAMAKMVDRDHFEPGPTPPTEGNVREAQPGWERADGGWGGAAEAPAKRIAAAIAVPVTAAVSLTALVMRRRRRAAAAGRAR